MTDQTLKLGIDLSVPRAMAARTNFIAGTKGSGKTYTAGVIAEEMLGADVHVVILDPLGVWWGLRHDDKGGPGGYPIVILGGEHGDRPLLPTAGSIVAEYIVRSGQSVILDMSGFDSNAAQDRFVTELLHKLFRLKASEKSALHLIIDEADMFAPQQPTSATEIPLLGATKTIVTKGRSRGLSMTMITQRPQSIAKAAIEEADVVLCHRMQGVNAVKAMKGWTDLYASKEEAATFFETLPTLADGECWVWSPQFLKRFERKQIRRKRTFDSSRTPDPGETAKKPKAAAAVDLDKLTDEMRATAEEVAKNDPSLLRKELAELRRQLSARPAETKTVEKLVEVPVLKNGQLDRTEKAAARLESVFEKLASEAEKCRIEYAELRRMIAPASAPRPVPTAVAVARPAAPPRPAFQRPAPVVTSDSGPLPEGERKVLTAAAQYPEGAERDQLSILAGYKRSTRDAYIQRLSTKGYVQIEGLRVIATDAGVTALGADFEPLPTGQELQAYWLDRLPEGERKVFEVLVTNHPAPVDREQIGEATGYKRSTRDAYIQRLGTRRLIETMGRGGVKASDDLF